jgi:hypothetical protein
MRLEGAEAMAGGRTPPRDAGATTSLLHGRLPGVFYRWNGKGSVDSKKRAELGPHCQLERGYFVIHRCHGLIPGLLILRGYRR